MIIDLEAIESRFALDGREQGPAHAAALVRGGETLWSRIYGREKLGGGPADAKTRYRIASITKPMTALVMASLEAEGRLSLADPIGKVLPEFAGDPDISLARLLNMRSGLPEMYTLLGLATGSWHEAPRRADTGAQRVMLSALRHRDFAPGSRTTYSNSNHVLIEWAIERLTDQSFETHLAERVFGPAGMATAILCEGPAHRLANTAMAYARKGEGFRPGDPDTFMGASGGVVAALSDLVAFVAWLRGDPYGFRQRLLVVDATAGGPASWYRRGFGVQTVAGRTMFGHSGGVDGWACDLLIDPEADLAAVMLSARSDINTIERTREMLTLALGLAADPGHTPRLHRAEAPRPLWKATYACRDWGQSVDLEGGPEEWVMEGRRMPRLPDGGFARRLGVEPIRFEADGDLTAPPASLTRSEGAETFTLIRAGDVEQDTARDALGLYGRTDAPIRFSLALDPRGEVRLVLGEPWPAAPPRRLRPVLRDFWRVLLEDGTPDDLHLVARRDAHGSVTSLTVSGLRVRHMAFERIGDPEPMAFFNRDASVDRPLSGLRR